MFYLAQNECLEGKASRLQEQLSALSDQLERVKAEQSQRLQEKERLLERQETLQGQLEQQVSRGREKVRNCYYCDSPVDSPVGSPVVLAAAAAAAAVAAVAAVAAAVAADAAATAVVDVVALCRQGYSKTREKHRGFQREGSRGRRGKGMQNPGLSLVPC